MTAKDFSKAFTQLANKPAKWAKFVKHNKPTERNFGFGVTRCGVCGTTRGHISKYGLNICRRCFRANASKLGFKKLN